MSTTATLLSLLAALLELDTTYLFQTLVSRPIIAGPLFGLLLGEPMAGLQVGVFAELILVDISPLGGIIPPSGVVATAVPMIMYHSGVDLYFGFFVGIVAAIVYSFIDTFLRRTRSTWIVFLEAKISKHPGALLHTILYTLALSFLVTFVFISLVSWISTWLIFILFPYITPKVHLAFHLAYAAVPWIGLAALIPSFRLKTR